MGIAAYDRASAVVCFRIRMGHNLRSISDTQMICRAEALIEQFDQFSRQAQDLYWDSVYGDSAKGMLKSLIHANYQRKRAQKSFIGLIQEAGLAHNAWVDCDRRNSLAYMLASRRKAKAWHAILSSLNRSFHLPFNMPNFGA